MEFLITRAELLLVFHISRSQSYDLHRDGYLSQPRKWCGSGRRFCLRTAAYEFAKLNELEMPSDETILHFWNSIVQTRRQDAIQLANKPK